MPSEIQLVVGLGNPGRKYDRTRHNVGFDVVDRLAVISGAKFRFDKKSNAETARASSGVTFVKPQTFMNASGESVAALSNFFKLKPEQVLVVYDDVALPIGRLRFRENGSAGGHNGVKSIIQHLGGDRFPRLKIGIGDAEGSREMIGHVLGRFAPEEREEIEKSLEKATDAVNYALAHGIAEAMNRFNQNPVKKQSQPKESVAPADSPEEAPPPQTPHSQP